MVGISDRAAISPVELLPAAGHLEALSNAGQRISRYDSVLGLRLCPLGRFVGRLYYPAGDHEIHGDADDMHQAAGRYRRALATGILDIRRTCGDIARRDSHPRISPVRGRIRHVRQLIPTQNNRVVGVAMVI